MEETEESLMSSNKAKPVREYTAIEEVVLIFLDSMLPELVESWTTLEVEPMSETSIVNKPEESSEIASKTTSQVSIAGRKRKSSKEGKGKRSASLDSQKSKVVKSTSKMSQVNKKESSQSSTNTVSTAPPDWRLKKPNQTAIVKLKNGTIYEGPISRLMMEGRGIFKWTDGSSYEGTFVENTATGFGKMIFPDLSWYEGSFLEGYRHGYGSFSVGCTTMSYCGDWYVGTKHGDGYMIYVENNYYDGRWENNKRHGFGHRLYGNGCYYCGQYENGERHGLGTIYWRNNNLYKGEWKNGLMDGYGEYVWNGFFNKSLSCPIENTYHGHWRLGKRHGRGMLNFGLISGARFEGFFKNGLKHGAGFLFCGNGSIVIGNPMFLYDNPIHFVKPQIYPSPLELSEMLEYVPESKKKEIAAQCSRHTKGHKLRKNVSNEISDQMIPYKKEIAYYQAPTISLPIHTPCHMLDLNYIVRKVCDKYEMCTQRSDNTLLMLGKKFRNGSIKPCDVSALNVLLDQKSLESIGSDEEDSKEIKEEKDGKSNSQTTTVFTDPNQELYEETWIRHSILMHMPRLWEIYHQYANICNDGDHKQQRSIMIRIFLWQLYRDCQITAKQLSLVEIDELLAENPQSFVESVSNPFEKILFWQFLQSLLLIAWALYNEDATESENIRGILAGAFTKFLFNDLYPLAGKFQGSVLFQYRDVAPIEAMYEFFKTFGNPFTARSFLLHACPRTNEQPKHTEKVPTLRRHAPNVYKGTNSVTICDNLLYLPGESSFGQDTMRDSESDFQDASTYDEFFYNLFCLRSIGVVEMIECIRIVCPSTVSKKLVLNLNYKLTFLEFYEIIIRCIERDIDQTRVRLKREEEVKRRLQAMLNPTSTGKISKNSLNRSKMSRQFHSGSAKFDKHTLENPVARPRERLGGPLFYSVRQYGKGILDTGWQSYYEQEPREYLGYQQVRSTYNRLGQDPNNYFKTTYREMYQKLDPIPKEVPASAKSKKINFLTYSPHMEMACKDLPCEKSDPNDYLTTMRKAYTPPYPKALKRVERKLPPWGLYRKKSTQETLECENKFLDEALMDHIKTIQQTKGPLFRSYNPMTQRYTDEPEYCP